MIEKIKSQDAVSASVQSGKGLSEQIKGGGVFTVTCFDKDGNQKWEAKSHNLVVDVGLNDMNDKYFSGSSYDAGWFIGLYGAASTNNPAASDTMASHAGWTEVTAYSQATRPQCNFGSASADSPGTSIISNSGSVAVFSINNTVTVGGAFLASNSTKDGTTGILFSAADFQAPGDRSVVSGDTLNVTYQFSLAAA